MNVKSYLGKFIAAFAGLALTCGLTVFLAAPAAGAAPPDGCVTTGNSSPDSVMLSACAYDEQSHSVNVNLVDRASASGRIQLTYFNPNAKAWSLHAAKRCKLIYVSINWSKAHIQRVVKANQRKVNGTWCVRLKHGSTWANSGKEGKRKVPFTATVHGRWSLMVLKFPKKGVWVHKGEFVNGHFRQVCENWWMIGVHPTLTEHDVIMLRSEAQVTYKVNYSQLSLGAVSVTGVLHCPTGDLYGSASASARGESSNTIFVQASSFAQAQIRGAAQAEADVEALAKARINAQSSVESLALAQVHLQCSGTPPTNQLPSGEIVQFAEHLFPGGEYRYKVVGSDPEDLGNVTLTYTVTGAAEKIVDLNHPEICDTEGTQRVCTFWVKAKATPGDFTVSLTVTDSDGATFFTSITKPVVPDNF